MDITLRAVTVDEMIGFHRAVATAFGTIGSDDEVTEWGVGLEPERTIAAFDGDSIVGTAGAFTFELTVPGGALVPTAGVTVVGVHPTHRRRGLLRRMMDAQLDDVAARGEPLAVLTASESAIYSRFGYGLATFAARWTLRTEGTVLASPSRAVGRVRLLDAKEALAVVPALYDAARKRQVGEVTRSAEVWQHDLGDRPGGKGPRKVFTAVHESVDGRADGFARYAVREDWSDGIAQHMLEVIDLYALDDEVEAALWQFLLDIDLVARITAHRRPLDEPLRWRLEDPRRMVTGTVIDHLWVRVLDPARGLAARTYAGDDRIVLDLHDAFRPANDGRWSITPTPDGAAVQRTDADADLVLSAADLGSLYLGGVSATTLARAGRVVALTEGALARADRLFGVSPLPWCRTEF
ncbi:MAG TPA: GNAT family N-acetyltransferase [Acidimicrobiia bacterium]